MSGTILVTGGTIGKFVVDGLTEKGKKVRVSTSLLSELAENSARTYPE
jgi:nucleoside-diphosphate-sugar epimerase